MDYILVSSYLVVCCKSLVVCHMNPKTQLLHSIYSLPGFGEMSLRKIANTFESAEEILSASPEKLREIGILPRSAGVFLTHRNTLNISADWEVLQKNKISVFAPDDPGYPPLLREIPDAPPLLYVRGSASALLSRPCVAIVGTRKPTDYGRHITRTLARELSHAGVVVVSGLALGLDAEAHQSTIEAQGVTVAVLGNGLLKKHIAPRNNIALAESIIAHGGSLVSELSPDTPASVGTFPMRNRIIAGLSTATVVVEAGEKSGTLITARLALEYNRDVFAVPGSILSPLSQGANRLLKAGAHPVTCTKTSSISSRLARSPAPKKSIFPIISPRKIRAF
jgi:DNA processing protein